MGNRAKGSNESGGGIYLSGGGRKTGTFGRDNAVQSETIFGKPRAGIPDPAKKEPVAAVKIVIRGFSERDRYDQEAIRKYFLDTYEWLCSKEVEDCGLARVFTGRLQL